MGMKRPPGANADEWALFLSEHVGAFDYLGVQIAEAIESAEARGSIAPLPKITRWTAARKAATLRLIDQGELTPALARTFYGIGAEELETWRRRAAAGGLNALRQCAYIRRDERVRALAASENYRAGDEASNFTTSNGVAVTIIVNPDYKPRIVSNDGSIREVEPGWEGDMAREKAT